MKEIVCWGAIGCLAIFTILVAILFTSINPNNRPDRW